MNEAEHPRVQRLVPEGVRDLSQMWIPRCLPIQGIANDGMTAFGEVDANLVRAARLQTTRDKRRMRKAFERLDVRDGVTSFLQPPREVHALGRVPPVKG